MPGPKITRRKGALAARRGGSRNLKKTTAKGAYAPKAKAAFRKRRQPFVETKKRESAIVTFKNDEAEIDPLLHPLYAQVPMIFRDIQNDDAYTNVPLMSFCRMNMGLLEDQCVGDTIYARYLKCKTEIKFPHNMNLLIETNKVYLIQGWVTAPIHANANRGVNGGVGTDAASVTATDVQSHIINSVKQYFDQPEDRLRFIPKATSDIKVLRKVQLKPKHDNATFLPPSLRGEAGFVGTGGSIPDVHHNFTWKINRKITYNTGTGQDGKTTPGNNNVPTDLMNMYPNGSWLPFLCIYSPQFAKYKSGQTATGAEVFNQIRYNDCLWYGDS